MKKRYARILAATLSAAMVFTSAPVNFTGIDLGVIEAKAAENASDEDALADAVELAFTAGNVKDKLAIPYGGSVTAQSVADDILSEVITEAAKAVDTDKGSNMTIATKGSGGTDSKVVVKESKGTQKTVDDYTATITFYSGAYSYEKDVPFKIKAKANTTAITESAFKTLVEQTTYSAAYNASYDADAKQAAQAALTAGRPAVVSSFDTVTATTATANKVGSFTATVAAQLNITDYSPEGTWADASTFKVTTYPSYVITAKAGTLTKLPASAEYKYVKDATAVAEANFVDGKFKDANGDAISDPAITDTDGQLEIDGWKANAQDVLKLISAAPATSVTLRMTRRVADLTTTDYSQFGTVTPDSEGSANGTVSTTMTVTISKATVTLPTIGAGALEAKYTIGDKEIKLDGTNKDKYVITSAPAVDKLEYPTTKKVTIETVDSYPAAVYDVDGFINNDSSWTYAGGKFSKEIGIAVTVKTLKATDIEWPTKLANDAKIYVGDVVADLTLAETATSKYGTFTLSKTGASVAAIGDKSYTITFTPNSKVAAVAGTSNDADVTSSAGTFTKAFAVSVTKKSVKSSDITVRMTGVDKADLVYGYTYATLLNTIKTTAGTYDRTEANGTWSVKEGASYIPMGTSTVTFVYTLKDSTNYAIDGEKSSYEIPVSITIAKPKYSLVTDDVKVIKIGESTPANKQITAAFEWNTANGNYPAGMSGADIDSIKYQWYSKAKGAIYGAQDEDLTIDVASMATDTYWCVATVKLVDTLTTAQKTAWKEIIGDGVIKSNECKVTVSNTLISSDTVTQPLTYGAIDGEAQLKATVGDGYTLKSITWACVSKATKESVAMESKTTSAGLSTATIPENLDAGDYTAIATITATSDKNPTDVVEFPIEFTVDKATLATSKFKYDAITFDKDAKIVKFGTKISDIKFTPATDADKYGSYEYINDEIPSIATLATDKFEFVQFIPNAETKNNYDNWDAAGSDIVEIDGITVEKGEIVIKANDITVDLGAKVFATDITTKVDGLVGTDTLKQLGITLSYELGAVDTTKAGTYTGVLKVTAKKDDKADDKIELDNYTVKVVAGNVIVKAAAPVVKPTPAPVKQATAAAPKAAKAKATVKAGKKYTLKLKYAAGKKATVKKVTWKSSKKSVATVSSKGKVTAKKAGKATITATITFKDGSKKKVKFTVTVK